MVRDFLHPKLRFGTESSFELLDSQGTNQKAQAETGRALGKKQGALTSGPQALLVAGETMDRAPRDLHGTLPHAH